MIINNCRRFLLLAFEELHSAGVADAQVAGDFRDADRLLVDLAPPIAGAVILLSIRTFMECLRVCSPCRRGCLRIEGSAGWWLCSRVVVGLASIAAGGRGHELSYPKLLVVDPDRGG